MKASTPTFGRAFASLFACGALACATPARALTYFPSPESIVANPAPGGLGKDGAPFDAFGAAMVRDGDTLLIGTIKDGIGAVRNAGSVNVFRRDGDGWLIADKLVAPDPTEDSRFGYGLALAGDTAFVSAPARGAGTVYVFGRSGGSWHYSARIDAPVGIDTSSLFGFALAGTADELFVGAPSAANQDGAVFHYVRSGSAWIARDPIATTGVDDPQHLGTAIVLRGDDLFVGADGGFTTHGAVHVYARAAGEWMHQSRLLASDAQAGDRFGAALALAQDALVVGAPGYSGYVVGGGYLFRRSGASWLEAAILRPANAAYVDRLGSAVAIDGNRIVLGGPGRRYGDGTLFVYDCVAGSCDFGTELSAASNTRVGLGVSVSLVGDELLSGASYAFVFSHDSQGKVLSFRWSGTHWLDAPTLDTGIGYQAGSFGLAVAAERRTMIACARDTPAQSGTCYVYERIASGWRLRQEMAPLDPRYFAYFGSSVALSGDTAVVGAPGRGSAYVFQRSASGFWAQRARFDGTASANFGQVVAVRGDVVAVGAPITAFPPGLGAVHVYERAGESWTERAFFLVPEAERLGSSIGLGENLLIAGAPGGDGAGAAFVFARNAGTWSLQQSLAPTDAQSRMEFGAAVALDGDRALIGATGASAGPDGVTGVVYDFARVDGSWSQQGSFTASDRGVGDEFGSGIALEGCRALIASRYHRWGDEAYIRGAVYVHDLTAAGTWNETAQLRLPESGTSPAIAIAGECLLIGAFAASTETGAFANPQSGGVYSFGCNLFGDGFE